jgi:hypothetical protein
VRAPKALTRKFEDSVIRCVLFGAPSQNQPPRVNDPPPAYSETSYGGKRLDTVFFLDLNTNTPHKVGPVTLDMPVQVFRQIVSEKQSTDPEFVRIIYMGKQLEDLNRYRTPQTLKT